jgi:hypothetical protein
VVATEREHGAGDQALRPALRRCEPRARSPVGLVHDAFVARDLGAQGVQHGRLAAAGRPRDDDVEAGPHARGEQPADRFV